ncbi:MAG: hypothetical protein EOO22_00645 [Comamonadaceae bacterium]|nr:MAG: hypothetical protein EOO22_00645 [Comamonadaceae bacterium]
MVEKIKPIPSRQITGPGTHSISKFQSNAREMLHGICMNISQYKKRLSSKLPSIPAKSSQSSKFAKALTASTPSTQRNLDRTVATEADGVLRKRK